MGYDFAKTVGFPEKSKDFLGRGGTTVRVSFRACTEMSDTKFVTTRAKRRCGETPGQGQKNDIQTDRQNTHEKDSVDVLYRNKQGNCIDSFRFNRQQVPISL